MTTVEGRVVKIVITGTGTIRIQQMIATIVNIPGVTRGGQHMNLIRHQRHRDIRDVMKVKFAISKAYSALKLSFFR